MAATFEGGGRGIVSRRDIQKLLKQSGVVGPNLQSTYMVVYFIYILGMCMFLFFLLEDNCFTMLCWFLPYNNMNQSQLYIYTYTYIPSLLSFPLSFHPTPQVITEHQAALPVLYINFEKFKVIFIPDPLFLIRIDFILFSKSLQKLLSFFPLAYQKFTVIVFDAASCTEAYMSMLIPHFVIPSLFSTMSSHPLSASAFPFLPCILYILLKLNIYTRSCT